MVKSVSVRDPRTDRQYDLNEPWVRTDARNFLCGEFWNLAWDYKRSAKARLWIKPVFYLPIIYCVCDGCGEVGVMNALYSVCTIKDTVFKIPTLEEPLSDMFKIYIPWSRCVRVCR